MIQQLEVCGFGLALAFSAALASANPLDEWVVRYPQLSFNGLLSVTCGNDDYVALAREGYTYSSQDGLVWTRSSAALPLTLGPLGPGYARGSLTFGRGLFVAVGYNGAIATSSDGLNWTPQVSGSSNLLQRVRYGGDLFVVVGAAGTIVTSPDGTNWTRQVSGTTNDLGAVAYGNGIFVAAGGSRGYLYSNQATVLRQREIIT